MTFFEGENPGGFSGARAIAAEGARVGVITCLDCGCALFMDPSDNFDVIEIHSKVCAPKQERVKKDAD